MFPEKKKSLFKSFKFTEPGNIATWLGQILLVAVGGGRLSMGALTDGSPTGQDSLAITFHSDRCDDFDRASPVFPLNSFRLQGI